MFREDKYQLKTLLESKDKDEEKAFRGFVKKKSKVLYEKGNMENVSLPQNENSFALSPLEIFQKTSPLERRRLFFKSLNFGDIFYLKVLKELPDCYKLLAIDKYKGCVKIDDLSIVMELPKFLQELKYLNGLPFQFIKAALSACSVKERILCVTLDSSIVRDEFKNIELGPIYSPYKAHYDGEVVLGNSFTDNLYGGEISKRKQLQEFANLEIKTGMVCPGFKQFHEKIPSSCSPSHHKKNEVHETSLSYYEQALSFFNKGDFCTTLFLLKQSLSIWDENYKSLLLAIKCCTLLNDGPNAFLYGERAFKLNQKSLLPRDPLFDLLLGIVHINVTQKKKHFAVQTLKMASIVDPNNENVFNIHNTLSS